MQQVKVMVSKSPIRREQWPLTRPLSSKYPTERKTNQTSKYNHNVKLELEFKKFWHRAIRDGIDSINIKRETERIYIKENYHIEAGAATVRKPNNGDPLALAAALASWRVEEKADSMGEAD